MEWDRSKVYTEDKLRFLKEDETIIDLALVMLKILSKYESEQSTGVKEERYKNIHACLETHSDKLDEFEMMTKELHGYLQKAKESIYSKSLYINQDTNIEEVKSYFIRIFREIAPYIKEARKIIENLEELNSELLYCFFNHETWGSTWCIELYIPKKILLSSSEKERLELVINRILNFKLFNQPKLIDYVIWDYGNELYYKLTPEEFDNYIFKDKDYFSINSKICHEIFNHLREVIKNLRDACRVVLREIERYRREVETFSDEVFKRVLNNLMAKLESNENYNTILQKNIILRKKCITLIRLIYDYKKEVEESRWKETMHFNDENDFRDNLFNYLNQVRGEKIWVMKETQVSRGRIDLLINNDIVFELKLEKNPAKMNNFSGLSQIKEYMASTSSKIGFFVIMDISKQTKPLASLENYFNAKVEKGGRCVSHEEDEHPIGIITVLIFGGERARPSELRESR